MSGLGVSDKHVLVHFSGLAKQYGGRQIFSDVDIDLYASQSHLLVGENGSGKSTLLRVMSGLLKPERGSVHFAGQNSHIGQSWKQQQPSLRAFIMYMHQMPYLFDGSVEKNLSYAINTGLSPDQKKEQLTKALEWSGLDSLANNAAKQLSGGEKQRVALARAWLRKPRILLLDEPTASLDRASRIKTLALLRSLKDSGVSLLISCHEYQEFMSISDGTFELSQGRLQKI